MSEGPNDGTSGSGCDETTNLGGSIDGVTTPQASIGADAAAGSTAAAPGTAPTEPVVQPVDRVAAEEPLLKTALETTREATREATHEARSAAANAADTSVFAAPKDLVMEKGAGPAKRAESRKPCAKPNSSDIDFGIPTLKHFATFTRVTQTLEGYIVAAMRENRRLDHILIHGRAGSGTTVLARALVRDYAPSRYEELDALTGAPLPKLKRALARANRRGVVLIRHVELLQPDAAHYLAEYMSGKAFDPEELTQAEDGLSSLFESPRDREIAASARDSGAKKAPRERVNPGGTVIATALLAGQLPYLLRSRFEQMIHLRNDPKALRVALARVLRPHGIQVASDAFTRVERVLGTLTESTEQIARAILARAALEQVDAIDDTLMKSIVEEDLADRLPNSHYAASLREHLAGREVKEATHEEIVRIASETGWGDTAARDAIATMIRENRSIKREERPQTPM